jgi:hypothetical protein
MTDRGVAAATETDTLTHTTTKQREGLRESEKEALGTLASR